ncbi:MAG TPA: hypothetical protein VGF75_02275 [Candidatus Saccharimonadales bacterium]|jgi:hypothetical protein
MKYLKLIVATVSLVSLLSIGSVAAAPVASPPADTATPPTTSNSFDGDACDAISTTISSSGCSNGNSLKDIVKNVVNIMSIGVGVISVIMIIVAGFKFITGGGGANGTASARNTLIYAVVGVIVAVLAQFIVHIVLTTSNTVQNPSYLNNSLVIKDDS